MSHIFAPISLYLQVLPLDYVRKTYASVKQIPSLDWLKSVNSESGQTGSRVFTDYEYDEVFLIQSEEEKRLQSDKAYQHQQHSLRLTQQLSFVTSAFTIGIFICIKQNNMHYFRDMYRNELFQLKIIALTAGALYSGVLLTLTTIIIN